MENLKEKLFSLGTTDYQNRRGGYPKSGIPDSIEVYEFNGKINLDFCFKNTSQPAGEKWVKNYLNDYKADGITLNVISLQDGDYQDDWIRVIATYTPEKNKEEEKNKVEEKNEVVEPVANKKEKKEKVSEIIYGIKVAKGINQTFIWKLLKKVCENKDEEGIKIAKDLKEKYPEIFANATKCLVSKKKIEYINSIV